MRDPRHPPEYETEPDVCPDCDGVGGALCRTCTEPVDPYPEPPESRDDGPPLYLPEWGGDR